MYIPSTFDFNTYVWQRQIRKKDKSNGDLLWPLCPEKFRIYRTVLIGEMSHNWRGDCTWIGFVNCYSNATHYNLAAPGTNGNCNAYFCFGPLHGNELTFWLGRARSFCEKSGFFVVAKTGSINSAPSTSTPLTPPPLILPLRLRPLCFYSSGSALFHSHPPALPPRFYPSDSSPPYLPLRLGSFGVGGSSVILYVNVTVTAK